MAAHLQGITCSSCSDHTNQETGTHYSCCHQPYCAMLLAWLDTVCRYAIEVYVVTHSWGIYIPTLHAGCYINPYHSFTPLSFVHDTNDSDTSWSSYSTIALCVHQQDFNRWTLLQLVANIVDVRCLASECTSAVVLVDILWMCIMMAMCFIISAFSHNSVWSWAYKMAAVDLANCKQIIGCGMEWHTTPQWADYALIVYIPLNNTLQ